LWGSHENKFLRGRVRIGCDITCDMAYGSMIMDCRDCEYYEKYDGPELDPNGALVHMYLGYILIYAGRPDEAIGYTKKAIRLDPLPSLWPYKILGQSYLLNGQYEKALPEFKKALQLAPKSYIPHTWLALNYILLGREEEARASAEKALELAPFLSVSLQAKTQPYKNQADLELILDAMRKAGFPEKSN